MSTFSVPNSQGQTRTLYNTDKYGELWETFGVDLMSQGKIKSAGKMVKVKDSTNDINFGEVVAFATFNTSHYAVTGGTDKEMYACDVTNDVTVEDNWIKENTSGVFNEHTDAVVFGGNLLVSQPTDILAFDGTSDEEEWWTGEADSTDFPATYGSALSSLYTHAMAVLRGGQETLFVTDGNLVRYYNTTAGHSTVTLLADTTASCLDAGRDSMFVGTFTESNQNAVVYEIYVGDQLDGTPVARYAFPVDGKAVLILKVIEGIPFIFTDKGHWQAFNGSSFVTVASMPFAFTSELLSGMLTGNIAPSALNRPVSHNGADVHNQSIYFTLNAERYNLDKTPARTASGVWEFNTKTYQLTHRAPFVETTTQKGGYLGEQSGPLMIVDKPEAFMIGGFAINGQTNGLFALNDTAKFGYITTTEIESGTVADAMEALYLKAKTLTGTDSITAKYRTTLRDRQCVVGTLLNANTFNTTETVSVEVGDELTVLNGTLMGEVSTVTHVSTSETVTSIQVDRNIGTTGATVSVEVTNFKPLETAYTAEDGEFKRLGTSAVNPWIQYKVFFNGDVELRQLLHKGNSKVEL